MAQAAASFKNVRHSEDYGFFNGKQKDTDKKRIDRAGKTKEAEAYFLLKHGQTKPLTAKQLLDNPMFIYDFCCIDVQSESERTPIQAEVIQMLLND